MGEAKSKSLVQIFQDQQALDNILMDLQGEVSDEKVESITTMWMDEITSNLAEKADSYKYRQDALDQMAERLKSYSKEMAAGAKSMERISDALADRMKQVMLANGTPEIKGHKYKFKLSSSAPKVVVLNEGEIPAVYTREKVLIEIDKVAIKNAVEKGETVPGVSVERGFSLRSYVNKD